MDTKLSTSSTMLHKTNIVSIFSTLFAGFAADIKKMSFFAAALRVVRGLRLFTLVNRHKNLFNNCAYQAHIAKVANHDRLFFLTHRHYLAVGFTAMQRAQAAQTHYQRELQAFNADYFDAVYRKQGLILWQHHAEDTQFDIRLMPGNDVLYEGACSIVFHVDGVRICVVSYATLPNTLVFNTRQLQQKNLLNNAAILLVTRKQSTADHEYQKVFNKVFDRTTAAHMCIGALTGVAMAQGYQHILGISAGVHPSLTQEHQHHFDKAYDEFWLSIHGDKCSDYGYLIDLPLRMTPLQDLDAKTRKRAVSRRQHIQNTCSAAHSVLRNHLVNPSVSTFSLIAETIINAADESKRA